MKKFEFSDKCRNLRNFCFFLNSLFLLVLVTMLYVRPVSAQGCGHWEARMPQKINRQPMVYDAAREVMVLFENSSSGPGKTWEYDGSSWRAIYPSGPAPQKGADLAYDSARGVVVLYSSGKIWEWNGSTWNQPTPSAGPLPPSDCENEALVYDAARGVTILFGGKCGPWETRYMMTDTWTWDGTSWEKAAETGPEGRYNTKMVYDSERQVVILYGGTYELDWGDPEAHNDTWEWNGSEWILRQEHSEPGCVYAFGMAYDAKNKVPIVFGGGRFMGPTTDKVWEWNGSSWTERLFSGLNPRVSHSMAYDTKKQVVVVSGGYVERVSDSGHTTETLELDGNTWTLKHAGESPSPRFWHALAYDSLRGKSILFGGVDESLAVDARSQETWQWDGIKWQLLSSGGPSKRYLHAMAYDSVRDVVVLFGGVHPGVTDSETWEWDSASWVKKATSGPSLRGGHALVYDSARNKTILFGGAGFEGGGSLSRSNQTWEWDGESWLLRAGLATAPSPRYLHAMAYDEKRGIVVLFGGDAGTGTSSVPSRETWEWNGTEWSKRSEIGPSARMFHTMTYDTVRGVVVMYGGGAVLGGPYQRDTWEWDGSSWTKSFEAGPPELAGHATIYDAARRRTVLFGGADSDSEAVSETWELVIHDADEDGVTDCDDGCPNDPLKIAPGVCGCGTLDNDSDSDGALDCQDQCPSDASKTNPGVCGCGTADTDSDKDGTPDCNDQCPSDPAKVAPGGCGCGVADLDANSNNILDCLVTAEMVDRLTRMKKLVKQLRVPRTKKQKRKYRKNKKELKQLLAEVQGLVAASGAGIQTDGQIDLLKASNQVKKKVGKALKVNLANFKINKKKALRAVNKLLKGLRP